MTTLIIIGVVGAALALALRLIINAQSDSSAMPPVEVAPPAPGANGTDGATSNEITNRQ
jgi:hypothetical protein